MSVEARRRADVSVDTEPPSHALVEGFILAGALTHWTCAPNLSLLVTDQ